MQMEHLTIRGYEAPVSSTALYALVGCKHMGIYMIITTTLIRSHLSSNQFVFRMMASFVLASLLLICLMVHVRCSSFRLHILFVTIGSLLGTAFSGFYGTPTHRKIK